MNRQARIISTACAAALLAANLVTPASAFRGWTGAVSGANKVQEGMGAGKDDLSFSPLLLEMAKLIGRTGLPQGFFLENEHSAFPDEPGVDLRTLLLYQAGLIKMPVRLITGRKGQLKSEPLPTISVPRIPETAHDIDTNRDTAGSDLPSLASKPLPREPVSSQVVEPKANVGEPEKISLAMTKSRGAQPANAPLLSFDITRLQADLNRDTKDEHETATQLHAELPRLAMMMPRTNTMPFITKNSFRLWTYRPDARGLELRGVEQLNGSATAFNGTFVVATPQAIKSITGRHFDMASGRLLASNQGGELLFNTGLADVSIEPQATAIVEVSIGPNNSTRTVRIFALESGSGRSVVVNVPNGKEKTFKLDKGEALIIGDHQLTESDFAGTHLSAKNKLEEKVARGPFPVAQFLDQDSMLKSDAHIKTNERLTTLMDLKNRVESAK